jgi:hypothetical protein
VEVGTKMRLCHEHLLMARPGLCHTLVQYGVVCPRDISCKGYTHKPKYKGGGVMRYLAQPLSPMRALSLAQLCVNRTPLRFLALCLPIPPLHGCFGRQSRKPLSPC